MLICILLKDIDGTAVGPLIVSKVRAFSAQGQLVVSGDVATQVLASDNASQMQAKCKGDVDAYIQSITGSSPPNGSSYVVFGGRSN